MWALLIPILKAMGIGAAMGGGTAALTGGDVKKGAMMGAAGGGVGGAFGGLLGKGAGAASGSIPTAATGGGVTTGNAVLAGESAGSMAGATAAKQGFSELMKKAAMKTPQDTATNTLTSAAVPQMQMSQPGQVPEMPVNDDTLAMLEKLMQQSKYKGQLT